jgi:hypothetical protein
MSELRKKGRPMKRKVEGERCAKHLNRHLPAMGCGPKPSDDNPPTIINEYYINFCK